MGWWLEGLTQDRGNRRSVPRHAHFQVLWPSTVVFTARLSARWERGATGKRSAVLNLYPYKTRMSSHNLPLATICIKYAVYMLSIYNYKIPMLNSLLTDAYTKHMLSIYE